MLVFFKNIKRSSVKVILIIMVSFVAVSESTIKSLMGSWLDPCSIIIDTYFSDNEKNDGSEITTDIFVIGKLNIDTQIVFRSEDVKISRVFYQMKLGNDSKEGDLFFHPKVKSSCNIFPEADRRDPDGGLCLKKDIVYLTMFEGNEVAIRLKDFKGIYSYSFLISLDKRLDTLDNFYVYMTLMIDSESDQKKFKSSIDNTCKVETASVFNLYSRASSFGKLMSIIVFLVFFIFLMSFVKGNDDEKTK